jgi:hypothetical protein
MDAKPTMRSRMNLPRVEMARLRVKVRVREGAQTVYARTGQANAQLVRPRERVPLYKNGWACKACSKYPRLSTRMTPECCMGYFALRHAIMHVLCNKKHKTA